MLGIQKPKNKNDFDDLLGDVSLKAGNNKKKNNDFFSDLQFWYFILLFFSDIIYLESSIKIFYR